MHAGSVCACAMCISTSQYILVLFWIIHESVVVLFRPLAASFSNPTTIARNAYNYFFLFAPDFPLLSCSDARPLQQSMERPMRELTHSYLHLFGNDVLYISVFMPHAFRGQRKCFDVCFLLLFYCRYYALLAESHARCDREKCAAAQSRDAALFTFSECVPTLVPWVIGSPMPLFFPSFYASSISVCGSNGFSRNAPNKIVDKCFSAILTEFRLAWIAFIVCHTIWMASNSKPGKVKKTEITLAQCKTRLPIYGSTAAVNAY